MPDNRRIVMRCTVEWVTSDPNDLVKEAFTQYDASDRPSPIDFVEGAIRYASTSMNWEVPLSRTGHGFEIRVSGPEAWSVAFGQRED